MKSEHISLASSFPNTMQPQNSRIELLANGHSDAPAISAAPA